MNRREFSSQVPLSLGAALYLAAVAQAHAQLQLPKELQDAAQKALGNRTLGSGGSASGLAGISNADATAGLKSALELGSNAAVGLLGVVGGFWNNTKVQIPLPGFLNDAKQALSLTGWGPRLNELHQTINRAAEQAVPGAKNLLVNAVKSMSVDDAKGILTGGDTSVTNFFAGKTRAPLTDQFTPVVGGVVNRLKLTQQYDSVAGRASQLGMVDKDQSNVRGYVTGKALDGLYLVIGEQEKKFRANPLEAGSEIVRRVFGAMK